MKEKGYIRLYRSVKDNPVVWRDSDHVAIWVYLLLNATYQELDVIFKGSRLLLSPGQLIIGRKSIASELKIDENKVRRVLKYFESEQQITLEASNKNTLVTIRNWSLYQGRTDINEQKVTNKYTTNEQQVNTYNKENESNKVNKEKNKEVYGILKNVYLAEDEFAELQKLNLINKIDELSTYMGSNGKDYKSHYATILNWDKRRRENENHKKPSRFNIKPDYKA
jgi:ribosomal protein S15P/S13E